MANKRCKATILQGAAICRCDKEAGHTKAKESSEAIHDSGGITWYDNDPGLDQFDAPD